MSTNDPRSALRVRLQEAADAEGITVDQLLARLEDFREVANDYRLPDGSFDPAAVAAAERRLGMKAVTPGIRVRLIASRPITDWELAPGPVGTVSSVDEWRITVRLDEHIPALDEWENEVEISTNDVDGEWTEHAFAAAFWSYWEPVLA